MTTPVSSPHSGCKTFTLTVDMNNATFEENGLIEIQDILINLAHRFNRRPDDTGGFVKDSTGATAGDWEIANPEPGDEIEVVVAPYIWDAECGIYVKRTT